jgi:hypothetical protein
MKKTSTILALLALSVASATAGVEAAPAPSGKGTATPPPVIDPCAGPISYNNVELLYANTEFGGYYDGDSEDGLQVRVEFSPWKNIYFTGGFSWSDTDAGDAWSLSGGIGGYLPLTDNIHLAADIGLNYVESDYSYGPEVNPTGGASMYDYYSGSESDTGWYVRPHVRAKWGCFELHTGFLYVDTDTGGGYIGENDDNDLYYGGSSDDWGWFIQGYYQVAQGWDLTAGYITMDETEADTWNVGVRYKF